MNTDEVTFAKLIKEHSGIINSICRIYYRDTDDVKDARQDVLIALWKSLASFRNESKISTWIYKVSLNTILSRLRTERRQVNQSNSSPIEESHLIVSPFADDQLQSLKIIIEHLGNTEKALVILYLEGYNYKEIASMLALTETNVSTKLNRLREKLKQIYKSISYESRSI